MDVLRTVKCQNDVFTAKKILTVLSPREIPCTSYCETRQATPPDQSAGWFGSSLSFPFTAPSMRRTLRRPQGRSFTSYNPVVRRASHRRQYDTTVRKRPLGTRRQQYLSRDWSCLMILRSVRRHHSFQLCFSYIRRARLSSNHSSQQTHTPTSAQDTPPVLH